MSKRTKRNRGGSGKARRNAARGRVATDQARGGQEIALACLESRALFSVRPPPPDGVTAPNPPDSVLYSAKDGRCQELKTTTYCTHVESDELITSPHTIPRNFHPSRTHTRVVVSDGVARQNRTQGGAATLSDGVVLLVGGHRMWMLHRTQTGWS